MALQRTHLLLEAEQQKLLAEIARREGRSVSDVARDIIQQGLVEWQQKYRSERERRLAALENAHRLRESIQAQMGSAAYKVDLVELVHMIREDRDADTLERSR